MNEPRPQPLPSRFVARAAERAVEYRGLGYWGTEPVDVVADAARRYPERTALVERGTHLDYRAFDHAISDAAAVLQQRGVGVGDPVLLVVRNDIDSVVAIHAVLRAGGVAMLAGVGSGPSFVAEVVEQAGPRLVLDVDVLTELRGARPDGPLRPTPRSPDEPAMVIFTSGTTSRPKGVVHSMNTLLLTSQNYLDVGGLTPDDGFFLISPLASITGVLQAATAPPLIGARAVLEARSDPEASCTFLLETGASYFGGPDLLLNRVLDEAERRGVTDLPIRAVFVGGAMLDRRILDRAERDFGILVLRAYGSSEAPVSTVSRLDEPADERLADDGVALRGVELRAGSSSDAAECCIRGAHLFLGYVADADDQDAFDDGWFRTGDLADLRDGRLRIFGRIRDIVIRNGLKIPISEVEGLIAALPGVGQCAGYGVDDDETGERLAVAVLPESGATVTFEDLVAGLAATGIATWKLPEELVTWDEPFPETATGKVVRNQLDARAAGRPRTVAPRLR